MANNAFVVRHGLAVANLLTVNTTAAIIGANVLLDTVRVFAGNSTVNAVLNSISFTLANSTVTFSLVKPTAAEAGGSNFLKADGTWAAAGGGTPGGSNTELQFNDSGAFGGQANLIWDKALQRLIVTSPNTFVFKVSSPNTTATSFVIENTSTGSATVEWFVTGELHPDGVGDIGLYDATNDRQQLNIIPAGSVAIRRDAALKWSANAAYCAKAPDTGLSRAAAGIVAVGNGTPQNELGTLRAASLNAGANVFLNTTTLSIGNTTANLLANSILVSLANSTGIANLQPTQLVIGSATVNSLGIFTSNALYRDTFLGIGNSTINSVANSTLVSIRDASSTGNLTSTQVGLGANVQLTTVHLKAGNSTVNLTSNSIVVDLRNTTITSNLTPAQVSLGANVFLSTTTLSIGNSTANLFGNSIYFGVLNAAAGVVLRPGYITATGGGVLGIQPIGQPATYFGPYNHLSVSKAFIPLVSNFPRIGTSANVCDSYIASVTVTNATDYISTASHPFVDGDIVQFLAGTLPTGISNNTNYYVINANTTAFQVSTTEGGANVNITADGTNVDVYRPINSSTVGPVTVATGITVTVFNGSTWSIV